MFVEGGWKRPAEPPPPRRRRLTQREERVVLWIVAINVALLLVAPIGGATLVHAVASLLGGG